MSTTPTQPAATPAATTPAFVPATPIVTKGSRPTLPGDPAPRMYGYTRLSVVEFGGADPTGATDATEAFNKTIAALPADTGGEVYVPDGDFLINPDPANGLKLRSKLWFHMQKGTTLHLKTNDLIRYSGLPINQINNVRVTDGVIVGDRATHVFTEQKVASHNTHEWGHGITVYGASQVTIEGTVVRDCTGDGMSVSSSNSHDADDIAILGATFTNNRRQGTSIGKVTNFLMRGGEVSHTNGTKPEDGIDIEPESGGKTDNVVIDGVYIHDNHANGIETNQRANVNSPISNVTVVNCTIENNNACGLYTAGAQGLNVYNNTITHNGQTGHNISGGCTNVNISENTFGFNYDRGGAGRDRGDFTMFGFDKSVEADILSRGNPAELMVGRNYYL